MNIPNFLTSLRIFLIPVLIVIYYLPWEGRYYASAAIFGIAAITDWLDGFLARALNQSTPFGAFFDPVADKVMVSVALVILVAAYDNPLMTLASAVIVGREIVISALREWMAEMGKRASVAVSFVGKFKTTMQMIAIFILLSNAPGTGWADFGLFVLIIAALLTLWSMYIYLKAAWPELSASKSNDS
ncbi:CDP-diacylglycerol--glycerol-3-phosphate 3-phosphatidyltransferase [Marinomonas gallaica]|uniref:CDP-diacylglycerol--glycerol-3-phosphate 3-phosphatidyltransferase n=1 Tax=Marinomonas gallaica TaxID=1806667 RepID=A0A1C3JQF1_9GAMM|nr:CDP-diacylglycerol--glycerol-3-phosphate 3-phosphatidyltransferase [Marinomonas gallaica]SBT17491.1 CDP-diacylglycerol--glycerol-3-phosphate 3-phosphatidyltransferase [Marinomonas gallaica]SBT19683.1 CDP-diacylglycerol--glycerol-3-phosphate 3-phosphatidyltransferase [Marinomonas gallaica]